MGSREERDPELRHGCLRWRFRSRAATSVKLILWPTQTMRFPPPFSRRPGPWQALCGWARPLQPPELFMADRKIAVVDISPANASSCPLATTRAVRPCRARLWFLLHELFQRLNRPCVGAPPLLPSEERKEPVGGGSCHFEPCQSLDWGLLPKSRAALGWWTVTLFSTSVTTPSSGPLSSF